MIVLKGRNVNELWAKGMLALAQDGVEQDSRAGRVLVMPTPVVSVYERPYERVLLDPVRDANPFFHLMESLWMLAGRDDAAFLDRYVGDFGKRFAEKDGRIHGAYGYRWRHSMGFDQLEKVIARLRDNPNDRQAVIQMWDAAQYEDWRGGTQGRTHYGSDDLEEPQWRDRPCNTHVYLRVREERDYLGPGVRTVDSNYEGMSSPRKKLDLTVCCRSNDIVWGAYGANAVHFSVLQEYLAGRLGVSVGRMYQFSNNYHGYVDVLRRQGDPLILSAVPDPYTNPVRSLPMGKNWEAWDSDLRSFMEWHDEELWCGNTEELLRGPIYVNSWFAHTACPVAKANFLWKNGMKMDAIDQANSIDASDWRYATLAWMHRRIEA